MDNKSKNYIYISIIAVCVIVMIILGLDWRKNMVSNTNTTNTTASLKPKEEKVIVTVSTEVIEDGLENMGFLVTQEYYFTQVEKYTKEKKVFNVLPSTSEFMYSYDGAVMAGIDFEKIKISKDDEKKVITVDIPHSRVHTVTVDKDTFKTYSEKESLWNPLKLEDYNMSMAEFEEAAKEKALENGILERSDEQAQKIVDNFISNFPSSKGYEIRYEWRNDNES